MSSYLLSKPEKSLKGNINLTPSKSESNRALIIQALINQDIRIKNLADAEDTVILSKALSSKESIIDIGHAGTAMRFLTAYLALKTDKEIILTGSNRMKQRPIGILVDALISIGADIEYIEEEGFAPLKIKKSKLKGGKITIDGSMSSQFISALLLIGPSLENGIEINFKGELISKPYLTMTTKMMSYFGAEVKWQSHGIKVYPKKYLAREIKIESDWSAVSYWYEMAAFSDEAELSISGLKEESLQGDAIVRKIFKEIGVESDFVGEKLQITKSKNSSFKRTFFEYDFRDCPDLAQTVIATLAGLKIQGKFRGLSSLRIKETDRIEGLVNELKKFGIDLTVMHKDEIHLVDFGNPTSIPNICTYQDHRMAMSFAPMAFKFKEIIIQDPTVVKKSYPNFWNDLKSVGFKVTEITS